MWFWASVVAFVVAVCGLVYWWAVRLERREAERLEWEGFVESVRVVDPVQADLLLRLKGR